ncbi:Nucleoside triphosphate pyrophosphohydrolase/pyrophosphatase MazG [Geodia barretti]|uniref:Nucleoside triphosphate pyrophosphohydrolase/pyrophosphatase MazG n=1 Tax=Geodia barretti TaxID=519541 RepID=A0AA35SXC4_GEOBA|nr:Nucleoside triphosphate pyrophosphohydrolase/pyrophosphatase MazG [Geodia barretti]
MATSPTITDPTVVETDEGVELKRPLSINIQPILESVAGKLTDDEIDQWFVGFARANEGRGFYLEMTAEGELTVHPMVNMDSGNAEVEAVTDNMSTSPMNSPIPEERIGEFQSLIDVVARLRAPGGCPWDAEQTHESLKRNLLEECYETLEAIDEGEPQELAEELGDILVQVAFHADIAREAGEFDIADVLTAINRKLIRAAPPRLRRWRRV